MLEGKATAARYGNGQFLSAGAGSSSSRLPRILIEIREGDLAGPRIDAIDSRKAILVQRALGDGSIR